MLLKLTEAGRVLSRKNESVIRSAILSLTGLVEMLSKPDEEEQAPKKGKKKAAISSEQKKTAMESIRAIEASILRQSEALGDVRSLIRQAAKMKLDPLDRGYVWTRDIFPTACVVEHEDEFGTSTLLSMDYTIDRSGPMPVVLLGEPAQVEIAYLPIVSATTEADRDELEVEGEALNIREAEVDNLDGLEPKIVPLFEAVREDGTVPIKIADAGWGSSGYYSKDMLASWGPKVFREGMHMFWNHPTPTEERERPERDLRDLAAVLTENARWDDAGPDGPGLYATARVVEHYREAVKSLAGDIGLSMNVNGTAVIGEAEGRKGKIITSLVEKGGGSVDFVTRAGRGGKILSLMESARQRAWESNTQESKEEGVMKVELTETELATLKEAAGKMPELMTKLTESETKNVRLVERIVVKEAKDFVSEKVGSKLPEITKARLVESLTANPPIKADELDREAFAPIVEKAIADETEYINKIAGKGQVRGFGSVREAETGDGKGSGVSVESLKESFMRMGMSEKEAEIAAKGR